MTRNNEELFPKEKDMSRYDGWGYEDDYEAEDVPNERLEEIVSGLTPQQREAVEHRGSPVVILAGAGTGKTTALTSRIAHIIASGDAVPEEVVAVTFTNKAAKELQTRLKRKLNDDLHGMTVGTFHSICAKMLRENYDLFGVKQDYVIMDSDDQKRLIRRIGKSIYGKNVDKELLEAALDFIENVRGNPLEKKDILAKADQAVYNIYAQYEKTKNEDGVLDFTDLIAIVTESFYNGIVDPDIFASKWKHILVDEYQDTNGLQFAWLQQIAHGNPNLAVVGDDDQVLYSWRGARIENILDFPNHFEDVKVIRLEQNFRSTGHILDVANVVIEQNTKRLGKTLFTTADKGKKVEILDFLDADNEAEWIVDKVKAQISNGMKPSEIAILSRASHVLNLVSQKLTFAGIPYVLSGGRRFQDKAEIRDAMAYLRLAANPDDSSAFERVVNVPKRGMGDVAVKKIIEASDHSRELRANMTLLDIAKNYSIGKTLSGNVPEKLGEFVYAVKEANKLFWRGATAGKLLENVLTETGYIADLKLQLEEAKEAGDMSIADQTQARIDSIMDLYSIGKDKQPLELVEHLGLTEDGKAKKEDALWIGTIHAAKGLEWPLVIGVGWEENILPGWQALQEGGNALDEERRCAYVLITRAREHLFLTTTNERFQKPASPSRFLGDIPDEHSIRTEIG